MDRDETGGAAGAEISRIGATAAPGRRMTAGRKRDAVLRLLRGEPLEMVARELGVTAANLSGWRDAFLDAGAASLKARPRDDRDATIDRLRTKVGELTIARRSAAIHSRGDRGQEASAGTPSCSRPRSSGSRPEEAAALLGRGGRSDERRHLDLRRPPLRCRPRLPGVARPAVEPLPRPHGVTASGPTAPAGAAGTNARCGAGRGDPAGAHRQPLPRRGLPQGPSGASWPLSLRESIVRRRSIRSPHETAPAGAGGEIDGRGCAMPACARRRSGCVA